MSRIFHAALRMAPAVVLATAVTYVSTGRDAPPPATQVGTAAVTVVDDAARVVERVTYRTDVERVGDVLLADGRPVSVMDQSEVQSAWSLVEQVWPAERRGDLVQISVIREGPLGLVGVVHAASAGGWILSIDAADLDSPELVTETIVHELAHVVTLAPDRFTFGHETVCDGLTVDLGCAERDSVLARFSERFWPEGRPADPGADGFVDTYAGTAVHEDLAETFTALVFDWPIPEGTVAAAKIAFLESDPELAALHHELSSLDLQ
jgi:hypothetical protein